MAHAVMGRTEGHGLYLGADSGFRDCAWFIALKCLLAKTLWGEMLYILRQTQEQDCNLKSSQSYNFWGHGAKSHICYYV